MVFNIGKTLDKEFKTWKGNKMSKHTQGPWHWVEADSDIIRSIYEVNDGNENTIADCGISFANARLIAAAPELLAALERIIEYHVPKINPLLDASILSAQSAINKAKGE